MTKDQICVTKSVADTASPDQFNSTNKATNQGLCHFCYCSNTATMIDLDTGKSICIPCVVGIRGVRK